jgi:hypothetical protein
VGEAKAVTRRAKDPVALAQELVRALAAQQPAANDGPEALDEETKAAILERVRRSAERLRRERGR